jgi:lysophospholipase L1-like esterase
MALDAGLATSYPHRLLTLLADRYTAQTIEVYNAGFAGKRAAADRGRLSDALNETKPEVLLLLHGVNDLNRDGEAGIRRMIGSLEQLIDEATGKGVRVFVATLPPQRDDDESKGRAAAFLDKVNEEIREMAPDEGATLVDLFARMDLSLIGRDGLHPTEAGYERMAEIWFDALRAAYEVAEPAPEPETVTRPR